MQINKIIRKAIKRLEQEGKSLTPDFYAEAFCKEAKLANVEVEDCKHIKRFLESLPNELKKEIKNYRIQTLHELTRFLIAKISRTSQSKCSELLDAQSELNRSLLRSISMLHNFEATELAKKSLQMLKNASTASEIEYFKQLWDNFVESYDDTFLYKLQALGTVDSSDLKKTIENLKIVHKESKSSFDLKKIASALIASLTPSIAAHIDDNIGHVIDELEHNEQFLLDEDIEEQLKSAIKARIALDKQSVKEMVSSLEGILDKLSKRLLSMIEHSDGSTVEIQRVKKELESFSKNGEMNFQVAHKKLYTIVLALEENTIEFSTNLKSHSDDVEALKKRVVELENELKKAREEAKIDFLTKLYNKRALDEFLAMRESEFSRFGHNYSIVMFDIDYFKKVNDTYGHDAGDVILKSFAQILKKSSRDIDVVGRYGGEEFMAILTKTDKKGAFEYANKVREHVKRAKFLYKGKRIPITVSGGVAERKEHPSLESTIIAADEKLYVAKKAGRDQIAK